jgi:predicted ArsR family transcriptional regulator
MWGLYDDNITKNAIIVLLKKSGGLTIEELSKAVEITPMGIRQHLISLEKRGVVTYTAKRQGIGRPGFIYKLTEMADSLFPKSYDSFAIEILRDIERNDGKSKVDEIFNWRNKRIFRFRKEALSEKRNIVELLNGLKDILQSEGHLVDLEVCDGSYHLRQYNCPISRIALEYEEACRLELQMYKDLLHCDVQRLQSIKEGSQACIYVIPAV